MLENHKTAYALKIDLLEKLLAACKTFTRKDISKYLKTHVETAIPGMVLSLEKKAYDGKYQINYWGDSGIGYGNREVFYNVTDPAALIVQVGERMEGIREAMGKLTQDMQNLPAIVAAYDRMIQSMKDLDALSVAGYYMRDALPNFKA